MKYLPIILTVLPLMASADEPAHLGRLFFTPAERSNLDILRQNSKAPDKVIKADEISKDDDINTDSASSASKPVILNGYISRSDGKNTVWVNDQAVSENNASKALSVGRLNKNQVQVTVNNKSVTLKPGQVYDPNSGKVYDHLSEASQAVTDEETKPDSVVDTVAKKLGLEDLKKKTSDWIDALSAKPDAAATPGDKQ